jgi:dihydrofolate reductase
MKLTVHTFVTLDGVMQGPGGPDEDRSGGFAHGGWVVPFVDGDFGAIVEGWFGRAGEILLGRTTYDMMRAFWTEVTDPADAVAAALNGLPKHVVSTTLADPTWAGTTVIADDVVAAVRALKERPGGELQVHGSHGLVRTLHAAGLVDEYRILTFPVVVGPGKRLFPDDGAPTGFVPVASAVTGRGVVYQALRPSPLAVGEVVVEDGREVLV